MIRCLLYVSPAAAEEIQAVGKKLQTLLDRPDILVLSNFDISSSPETPSVDQMDMLVIEGSTNDADIGFLLAHAIARKKPTLYLYQRGTVAKVFSHLALNELPKWIHVVSYHDGSYDRHLEEFLTVAAGRTIRPSPRIKFTLRITAAIEAYLEHKTLNTKTSKADWLREQIERMMESDADWQKRRARRPVDE